MLHLDHRLGSLEKGKDADFVVLSGAPFSVYTQVLETYIDGEKVFDRSRHAGLDVPGRRLRPGRHGSGCRSARRRSSRWPPVKAPAAPADAGAEGRRRSGSPSCAGRIHTVGKGTINDGVILVEDGKITAVGPRGEFELPPTARRSLTAAVVTPGLIDAHSVVGLSGALQHPGRPGPGRAERPQPGRPARARRLQPRRAAAASSCASRA